MEYSLILKIKFINIFNSKKIKQMSFGTPQRRHSSLFERMEKEIKKIEKKLSLAKQSYRQIKEDTSKNKNNIKSFYSVQDKIPSTARKIPYSYNRKLEERTPNESTAKQMNSSSYRRRHSNVTPIKKQIEIFGEEERQSSVNKVIIKLQEQNNKLWYRLGKMQTICGEQSHKVGFLKAELTDKKKRISNVKEKQLKQNIYLTTLVEHYKNKATKYKVLLNQSSISIHTNFSDQN